VRGLFIATLVLAGAACATPTQHHQETLATLTAELPDYAPVPDDRVRVEGDVRAIAGGFSAGGAHAFAGGGALAGAVRRDDLMIRVEGEAAWLALGLDPMGRGGVLSGAPFGRLLRAGGALRWGALAIKGPSCHFCSKHAPPTEIDRLDIYVEGGAGEQWIQVGAGAVSRPDLELGAGLDFGPRHATDHWGIDLGVRMLVARSPDSSRIDHPIMLVIGGLLGS
jgi:hypothetical protein